MNFLLTNDDGIDAAGLAALRTAALPLGQPWVVAPEHCHSGCGHQVTTHNPIRFSQQAHDTFTTNGTPADCVRVALDRLETPMDWVLSGINHGGNLGADLYMSGTVAAVREGVLHGKPGIAVSHYHRKGVDPLDWNRAIQWLTPILGLLIGRPWQPGTFWNVNLPHRPSDSPTPEIIECPVDPSPLPVSFLAEGNQLVYNGNYHARPRHPGTDIDNCFSGRISISLVRLF
ncbi:MAG: 5'/3'-nucleotidase SurE [Planctomycetes bacterium]|nr:5'/3'-nucleotidase SurE [Planctomycetota bacterium]